MKQPFRKLENRQHSMVNPEKNKPGEVSSVVATASRLERGPWPQRGEGKNGATWGPLWVDFKFEEANAVRIYREKYQRRL